MREYLVQEHVTSCGLGTLAVFIFFFQAEDGIRDAQESRGLGDVYKRQDRGYARTRQHVYHKGKVVRHADASTFELFKPEVGITRAVSYTHLTLPTIYSV